jgi:Glycosyltransferase
MRILYINDAIAIWGGLERILVEKLNELSARYDYEMFLVTANQGKHPIPFPLSSRVVFHDLDIQFHRQYDYHCIKRLWMRAKLKRLFHKRLRKQIGLIEPDIIVCVRINYLAEVAKLKGKAHLFFESHSLRYEYDMSKKPFYKRLVVHRWHQSVAAASKVITLTQGDAEAWKEINNQVCVIPNIVHLNDSGRYSDCSSKSVIFVGRFSEQKDVSSLLVIWDIVHKRYSDWTLNIYGGYGEEQAKILQKIEQSNNGIIVHEPTSGIFDCYLKNSTLLLTSLYEPFGLVLPEAMSCGLPVVAFDCPFGPADIITNGIDGFLIKDRNIQEFADKVCLLIENPDMRIKMGLAGVLSSKRYAAAKIMPLWKELFDSYK